MVGVWVVISATVMRPPQIGAGGITDERVYYERASGFAHPVTVDDYSRNLRVAIGRIARSNARRHRWGLVLPFGASRLSYQGNTIVPLNRAFQDRVAVVVDAGLASYEAGLDVFVIDPQGLGDPIAARLQLVHRGRPGHEKYLPTAWVVARFAAPGRTGSRRRARLCGSGPSCDALRSPSRSPRGHE